MLTLSVIIKALVVVARVVVADLVVADQVVEAPAVRVAMLPAHVAHAEEPMVLREPQAADVRMAGIVLVVPIEAVSPLTRPGKPTRFSPHRGQVVTEMDCRTNRAESTVKDRLRQ